MPRSSTGECSSKSCSDVWWLDLCARDGISAEAGDSGGGEDGGGVD